MADVYFIRHGQSQANADGVLAGQFDSPLTEKGIQQAQNEAMMIRESGVIFDTIISSPLSRAYDTAIIIAEMNGFPVENIILMDDLKEKYGGSFEGQPLSRLHAATSEEVVGAGAESFEDFAIRVGRANEEIVRQMTGTTLIVAHAGFYRMAQAVYQLLPPADMRTIGDVINGKLVKYPL